MARLVFLFTCLHTCIAARKRRSEESQVEEESRSSSSRPYTYMLTTYEPGYVSDSPVPMVPKIELFQDLPWEYGVQTATYSDSSIEASSSVEETAKTFAAKFSLSTEFLAFSAAATASTESFQYEKVQTYRLVRDYYAQTKIVLPRWTTPWDSVKWDMRDVLIDESPQRIVSTLGSFFPKRVILGAELQTQHLVKKFRSESKSEVQASFQASADLFFVATVNTKFQTKIANDKLVVENKMSSRYSTKGGDSTRFLGVTPDTLGAVIKDWAASVNDTNYWPVKMDLRPLWEIYPSKYQAQADRLKEYLTAEWAKHQFYDTRFPYASMPTQIKRRRGGGCLTVSHPDSIGVKPVIKACESPPTARQLFVYDSSSHHIATTGHGATCLRGNPKERWNVRMDQYSPSDTYSQRKWKYEPSTGLIRLLDTNMCLDANMKDPVWMVRCTPSNANQQFTFESAVQ